MTANVAMSIYGTDSFYVGKNAIYRRIYRVPRIGDIL